MITEPSIRLLKINYKQVRYLLASFVILFNGASFSLCQDIYTQFSGKDYWHSQLSSYLNIRKSQLKLSQGALIVENKTYWLWNIFNSMPSNDSGIYYNPNQFNQFSSGYMTVLYNFPISPTIDPECHLNNAILKFVAANDTYAWDKSIHDLQVELSESEPFILKSDTIINLPNENDSLSNCTIKIDAQYNQMIVFYSNPYSKKNNEINNYSPWYTPCILKKSYVDSINWEPVFGKKGFMHHAIVALIVANKGSTTISVITENGSFSDTESSSMPIVIGVVMYTIKDFIMNTPEPALNDIE